MSRPTTNRPTDDPAWLASAACRAIRGNPALSDEIFFPLSENRSTVRRAQREFCGQCPVRAECLSGALARREVAGIWGGVTTTVRNRLMRHRTRIKCPLCLCRDMAVVEDESPSGAPVELSVCISCGASWVMEPRRDTEALDTAAGLAELGAAA